MAELEQKPTKEQFEDYVRIRDSGNTNMFHVRMVCALSRRNLKPSHCLYIMNHFKELCKEYEVEE